MKKTFQLTHPKIKYPRLIERVKNDVRKYIKRERSKTLPAEVDFWDFDCRFGDTEDDAKGVHLSEIDARITDAEARGILSFYVEILAKPACRSKKPKEGDEVVPPPIVAPPEFKKFGEG
jgi:hypothetical protein